MTAAHDDQQQYSYDHGPYTVADLDRKPRDARYELVNGWIVMSPWPSIRHDRVVDALRTLLRREVERAGADFYVGGPLDVATVAGIRVPDVGIVDNKAAQRAFAEDERAYRAADVRLAIEVISRQSGSERTDRYEKPSEYAASGIDSYWIVDLLPRINITHYRLVRGHRVYQRVERIFAGEAFEVEDPLPIKFDPAVLLEV